MVSCSWLHFLFLQVVIIAAVITAIIRKIRDEYIEAEILKFKDNDWHMDENLFKYVADETSVNRPKPPSAKFVAEARRKRLHEAKMIDVILEIVLYVCYLLLCLLIAYGHRDPDAYLATHHVEKMLYVNKFDQVSRFGNFRKGIHVGIFQ